MKLLIIAAVLIATLWPFYFIVAQLLSMPVINPDTSVIGLLLP